jgi:heptosyltransferase-2
MRTQKKMMIHVDCRHYRGEIPCKPHKDFDVHCEGCESYDPVDGHVLIIKLGAVGDVIRSTPLLHRLRESFPHREIHWLTHHPEILPDIVDRIYTYTIEHVEILKQIHFDLLINLDKDPEAGALALVISADEKKGFGLKQGRCVPLSDSAEPKWLTGLFDDLNRDNRLSYPEEIFAIAGWEYKGEEYILPVPEERSWELPAQKRIIGLNTGCGARWSTRLWPEKHWISLAEKITSTGDIALFLGGPDEHHKNERMADESGAMYLGFFALPDFISLMNQCVAVVTSVTMALHIALGLKKRVILFNNIFNPHEFELFDRGVILEPPVDCRGCFRQQCEIPCMERIEPEHVFTELQNLLSGNGE